MPLNAQQILEVRDRRTREVPVPEWGPEATVLIGSMGALDRARLTDWIATLGRAPQAPESQEELITCDSEEGAGVQSSAPAKADQFEGLLRSLMAAVRDGDEDPQELCERIQSVLESQEPPRSYTVAENMEVVIRWCALSILDPQTGQSAFTIEQVEALGAKNEAALRRIYEAAIDLNLATKRASDEFRKNSKRTAGNSSGGV